MPLGHTERLAGRIHDVEHSHVGSAVTGQHRRVHGASAVRVAANVVGCVGAVGHGVDGDAHAHRAGEVENHLGRKPEISRIRSARRVERALVH
ncbi:MAG: hypothetical protein ACK55I_43150, partial [bacterium]